MDHVTTKLVFRHLSGARASAVDVVPIGAHRELVLGRAPSATVRFDPVHDRSVGRFHARIEATAEAEVFRVVDLGSRNGTLLNGRLLSEPAILRPGDRLRLGADGPEVQIGLERQDVAWPATRGPWSKSPRSVTDSGL